MTVKKHGSSERRPIPLSEAFAYMFSGLLIGAGVAVAITYELTKTDHKTLTVPEAVHADGDAAAKLCGQKAIKLALGKYLILPNDPKTPADEAYDSAKKARDEGQKFVDDEFNKCLKEQFVEPFKVYFDAAKAPEFTPENAPVTKQG